MLDLSRRADISQGELTTAASTVDVAVFLSSASFDADDANKRKTTLNFGDILKSMSEGVGRPPYASMK